MKGTPEEVLKAIPDFEEFTKITDNISRLMYEKLSLDSKIKEGESLVFKRATTEEKYFQGGKPASSTYIDNTYKYAGLDGELIPLRQQLAKVISDLEGQRLLFDVYKTMIDVWRTMCSNQRTGSF